MKKKCAMIEIRTLWIYLSRKIHRLITRSKIKRESTTQVKQMSKEFIADWCKWIADWCRWIFEMKKLKLRSKENRIERRIIILWNEKIMCVNLEYVHCEYIYQKKFITWSWDRKWNENVRHKFCKDQKNLSLINAYELLKWSCWNETKHVFSTQTVQLSRKFIVD
jgi:hypothetical protein